MIGYSQDSQSHYTTNSCFFLRAHLELDYSWERDNHQDEIIQHVDDPRRKKEHVDVDTFSLSTTELCPKVGHWPARISHSYPNYDGIGECEKSAENYGKF